MPPLCASAQKRQFDDPDRYQAAIRGGDRLFTILERGTFRADLTDFSVGQVKLQRGREDLPRLAASGVPADKVGILVWPGGGRLPVVRGVQIEPGELVCLGPGMQSHHRTSGPNEFATMMLDASDFSRVAHEQTGREMAIAAGKVIRPPEPLMAGLLSLIRSAIRAGETTPKVLSSPQATNGLEQAFLQSMVACLADADAPRDRVRRGRRAALAKKFEEAVEANLDRPLFIRELSRMLGLSERSLRSLCQEQMGISPQRFLALRRLHLARQALLRGDPRSVTVTAIATGLRIWEFGRFAVTYRSLFGESPSVTLRRH